VEEWFVKAGINTKVVQTGLSLRHAGDVGIGYSIHARMVIVAGGTTDAEARLRRLGMILQRKLLKQMI
jgi:urocanate hydratase